MKICTMQELLNAEVLCCEENLGKHVYSACGCDLMSDVLAYVKDQAVLLTGLINSQVVRTAMMMDMVCIVFVRSKEPTEEMLKLAHDNGIVVLSTDKTLYESCGILYSNGLVNKAKKNMSDELIFRYDVDGNDFTSAGQASVMVKKNLRQLGISPEIIRRISIAMYEGEINMVIHAGGGVAEVRVNEDCIEIILEDHGPGIKDINQAMQEGFSTAPDEIRSLGFGAGMGLPNMKRHTDDILIESTVGVGTRIVMKVYNKVAV